MRPKNYYDAPVGPKNYDDVHDPCLKVKSINTRVDIIKEAIQASIIQGTQEPLIKPYPKYGLKVTQSDSRAQRSLFMPKNNNSHAIQKSHGIGI